MAYSIYLFISRWRELSTIKWLIIIPIIGLTQVVFSVIIGPVIVGTQINQTLKDSSLKKIQSYNLIFITIYGIVEYYSICRFLINNIKSVNLKKTTIWCSNITIATAFFLVLVSPESDIFVKKILTLTLSFQLIFFSIFLLAELIFDDIQENVHRNPIFIVTGAIFILFSSTCPIYYMSSYFAYNSIGVLNILNLTILISYAFYYSVLIYTLRWKKI